MLAELNFQSFQLLRGNNQVGIDDLLQCCGRTELKKLCKCLQRVPGLLILQIKVRFVKHGPRGKSEIQRIEARAEIRINTRVKSDGRVYNQIESAIRLFFREKQFGAKSVCKDEIGQWHKLDHLRT